MENGGEVEIHDSDRWAELAGLAHIPPTVDLTETVCPVI
jgi:hypothetical protein